MPRIIGIAGLTPESGKTTAALNLSASFSVYGKKNLVVDTDPDSEISKKIRPFMKNGQLVYRSLFPDTDFMPSGFEESRFFRRIAGDKGKTRKVLDIFMSYVSADYEYVIVDFPSRMDLLSISALAECNEIIIVIKYDRPDFESIHRLLSAIYRINIYYGRKTAVYGILTWGYVIPYTPAGSGSRPWPDEIAEHIVKIFIPYENKMDCRKEDGAYLMPICFRDILNPASISYLELCRTFTDGNPSKKMAE